jgi:putative flippase GtrA
MKNNLVSQIIVAAILVFLLIFLANPFHIWMPDMMVVSIVIAILIVFALFSSFVLREKVQDEREAIHRMLAGRVAFFTGSIILTLGILVQSFSHAVDIWLVAALVAMILAKIGTRIYSDRKL